MTAKTLQGIRRSLTGVTVAAIVVTATLAIKGFAQSPSKGGGGSSVQISDLSPSTGVIGSTVQISGSGFGSTNTVLFSGSKNSTVSAVVTAASSTSLTVRVPSGATTGKVVVQVGSAKSNGVQFKVITNQAPTVNAGTDLNVGLAGGANLSGAASDDGLINSTLSIAWSKVSGPGTVSFTKSNSLSTAATFSVAGTYVLRLAANDGALTSTDDITVVASAATPTPTTANQAPLVNAGPDQAITLPGGTTLAATVSDDLLPPGSTLATSWTQVSGPGAVTFGNPATLNSSVTFTTAGTYVLRLTASDTQLTSTDEVTIVATCGVVVSGTVTLSADATDNVGVVGLQFQLDGGNFGPESSITPYSITWDTTRTPNGCHTVTGMARDAAGNQGIVSVRANVSNP